MMDFTPDKTKFRSATSNRYLKGLFFEETLADKATVVYTLKDQDHLGYPSLYRLYMEEADPLEWRFASKYLDSYEHWEMLCDCNWFKPYLARWRKELELKLRSEALVRLMKDASSSSKTSTQSNRLLLDAGWVQTPKNAKGRPSKDAIKAEARRIAEDTQSQQDDLARITAVN